MAAEEYPKLPKEENVALVKINGTVLLEMIKKTAFAISTDETRYILNGVLFEAKDGASTRMVATDGHRLAMVQRPMEGDFKLKGGVIIPRKGLHELRRLLDEAPEAECQLGFAQNSVLFKKSGLTMVMRLIDGQFPEYQRVIPEKGERVATIPASRFLEALKRIALLSADKSNAVELEVSYHGAEMAVGFNARYLIDVLSVLDSDEVAFELGDEHSPGVLHAPQDRTYTAVVMPMRV